MNHHQNAEEQIELSPPNEDDPKQLILHREEGNNNQKHVHTTMASVSNNEIDSPNIMTEFVSTTIPFQGVLASFCTKLLEDDGEPNAKSTTTIDTAIVIPDATMPSTSTANEGQQDSKDTNAINTRNHDLIKIDKNHHHSTSSVYSSPLISKDLCSHHDHFNVCGVRRHSLPDHDNESSTCCSQEQHSNDLDPTSLDTRQSEPISDYIDYDFDPFTDQSHAPIVIQMPSSLVSFFANYYSEHHAQSYNVS